MNGTKEYAKQIAVFFFIVFLLFFSAPSFSIGAVFYDVEGDTGGWTATGLWHVTGTDAYEGTSSWWYGQEAPGNYDTGVANSGSLITPSINLGSEPELSFWSREQTESAATSYDKRIIYISNDDGTTWTQVYQSTDNSDAWHEIVLKSEISGYANSTVKFKFEFNTVDNYANAYKGWLIDNLNVTYLSTEKSFFDMEGNVSDWNSQSLWHITSSDAHSGSQSWWYGQEATGNYDTGALNSGSLITPPITLGSSPQISMWSREQTESADTSYDKRIVYISNDDGTTWTQVYQSIDNSNAWHEIVLESEIPSYCANSTVRLKFEFNTEDGYANTYKGWLIDDLMAIDLSEGTGLVPASITVVSGSNQVAEVNTTLSAPFKVLIKDATGNPVPNVEVNYSITQGEGYLYPTFALTDANGNAESSLTLSYSAGEIVVEATSPDISDQNVQFTAIAYLSGGSATDYDADGMSNTWEDDYGLNKFDPSDALQDKDNDGLSNIAEYTDGTNPASDSNGPSVSINQYPSSVVEGTASITVTFTADDTLSGMSIVTGGEYFVNTDPGKGQGTAISLTTSSPSTGEISVIIDTSSWIAAGSPYTLYIRAMDAANNWGIVSSVSISVTSAASSFDMEGSVNDWVAGGLWHITSTDAQSGSKSWWYGQEATGNYDTGDTNKGSLISPSISLGAGPELTFQSWEQTEGSGTSYDKRRVYVSTDGGTTWAQVYQSIYKGPHKRRLCLYGG